MGLCHIYITHVGVRASGLAPWATTSPGPVRPAPVASSRRVLELCNQHLLGRCEGNVRSPTCFPRQKLTSIRCDRRRRVISMGWDFLGVPCFECLGAAGANNKLAILICIKKLWLICIIAFKYKFTWFRNFESAYFFWPCKYFETKNLKFI